MTIITSQFPGNVSINREPQPQIQLSLETGKRRLLVIGHFPCADGFTALWAARRVYQSDAEYIKENVQNFSKTKELMKDPDSKNWSFLFVDMCPKRELLVKLYHHTNGHVRVLDHHKSNMEDCGDLHYTYFDMTRSGAGIAWDVLTYDKKRPFLVDLIEDRDLWRWAIPDARDYCAWLDTKSYTYKSWDDACRRLEDPVERAKILEAGRHYRKYRNIVVRQGIVTRNKLHALSVANETLPAINCPIFQSEVGALLAASSPNGAAAVYYRSARGYHFSLRSTEEGLDVSVLARHYGGGGHARASGFFLKNLEDLGKEPVVAEYTSGELNLFFPNIPEENSGAGQ